MNEFDLIRKLSQELPTNASVVVGPGDDCAVIDLGLSEEYILFKTDAVVEGIHYETGAAPEKIGHKALGRCLSDVAAMAGTPKCALITLALPKHFDPEVIQSIYQGINALAARFQVAIAGGETVMNPDRMIISVSLLGTVSKEKCVRRAGARPGDAILVTGRLGGSLLGKHLDFEPRLREAHWLANHFCIHSMIDLSDGLAGDLPHLLEQSACGAELLSSAIPISSEARTAYRLGKTKKSPLLAALTEGEDFELLFTIASREAVPLLDGWKRQFPDLHLGCIGKITRTRGVTIRDRQGRHPLRLHGYAHFA